MAKTELTYTCGCSRIVNLSGSMANRARMREWAATHPCRMCYVAARARPNQPILFTLDRLGDDRWAIAVCAKYAMREDLDERGYTLEEPGVPTIPLGRRWTTPQVFPTWVAAKAELRWLRRLGAVRTTRPPTVTVQRWLRRLRSGNLCRHCGAPLERVTYRFCSRPECEHERWRENYQRRIADPARKAELLRRQRERYAARLGRPLMPTGRKPLNESVGTADN